MKEKTPKPKKLILIGLLWIYLGTLIIVKITVDAIGHTNVAFSTDIILSSIISIFCIVIGTCFVLTKRWAHKITLALSIVFIAGFWGLGLKMIIYGISDIIKFHSPGSTLGLAFGLITLFSSFPFISVIAYINSKEVKGFFYKRGRQITKSTSKFCSLNAGTRFCLSWSSRIWPWR